MLSRRVVAVLLAFGFALSSRGDDGKQAKGVVPPVKDIKQRIDAEYDSLATLYKHLHANPELSFQEEQTAARMAAELKKAGFEVTTKVGGHGVVGVFKNGAGPTIMVRCDMDGLPITEATGLPYASKVRTRDKEGKEVGVMHACGHDMHMTCWVGTARVLMSLKDRWQGTLVFIAQPAEEAGGGARRMINDGLFKRFPRPEYCLGLHCSPSPTGTISYSEGVLLANVDTVDITIRGKGGHGAAPHTTVDPIVLAARIILDLQTLVSREISPTDPAVVTVGSIHGGTKHNIIPAEVKLQVTVRSLKDEVRKHLLDGIARICKSAAEGARAPEPIIRVELDDFTPAVYNDAKLAKKTAGLFKQLLGEESVRLVGPIMGGEDFSRYGREGIPIFFYFMGTTDSQRLVKQGGLGLAAMHSDKYYPDIDGSVKTGVLTMTSAVLNLLRPVRKNVNVKELIDELTGEDGAVRRCAIADVEKLGPKAVAAIPALVKIVAESAENAETRVDAAVALSRIGPDAEAVRAVPALVRVLENPKEPLKVRERVIWALRVHAVKLREMPAVLAAFARLQGEARTPQNKMLRYDSAYMLGILEGAKASDRTLDVLLEFLKDRDVAIYVSAGKDGKEAVKGDGRIMAVQALGMIRTRRADILAHLRVIADDETAWTRLRQDTQALLKALAP